MKKSDKFNASGYVDMTAFCALGNIEHEEAVRRKRDRSRKRKKKRRKSD